MEAIASQITSLTIVYSTVYSGVDQSKHQSSASLAFVWGIHRGPVNSPHKWSVTRKMFPFDDVIMSYMWWRMMGAWKTDECHLLSKHIITRIAFEAGRKMHIQNSLNVELITLPTSWNQNVFYDSTFEKSHWTTGCQTQPHVRTYWLVTHYVAPIQNLTCLWWVNSELDVLLVWSRIQYVC